MTSFLPALSLILTAALFGGMVLYSFGFAALVFKLFDQTQARYALRHAFPPYYLVVMITAALAAVPSAFVNATTAIILALTALTTLYARQILMPQINTATDAGETGKFKLLHGVSVILQLIQIAVVAYALTLFV
ncbi:DUF4149 domain-containing protein [Shimia ponticola]|uniref:DUF4149 domain-containing protein n=1 Tax=Shimia ponticola TaxID=2582893 RepID=UPI0011BEC384|nr:DUF4149 domain-containing protein [Shimia ponticola]